MLKKVQVWLRVFRSDEARVLLLRTGEDRKFIWQPVTGGVERSESFEDAALRETREETGLRFKATQLRDLELEFEFEGRWGMAKERVFLLDVEVKKLARVELDFSEHTFAAWASVPEALQLLPFATQKKAVRRVLDFPRRS